MDTPAKAYRSRVSLYPEPAITRGTLQRYRLPRRETFLGCSCDLSDGAGNMRRLADCGGPGLEQPIHSNRRRDRKQLMPRLVLRYLLDAQRATAAKHFRSMDQRPIHEFAERAAVVA